MWSPKCHGTAGQEDSAGLEQRDRVGPSLKSPGEYSRAGGPIIKEVKHQMRSAWEVCLDPTQLLLLLICSKQL